MSIDDEEKDLVARLAKVRAEREALEPERVRRERIAQMREQVEAEERALRDAPHIAKAEEDHGPIGSKIAVIETRLGSIVVKRPNHLIYKRFQDTGSFKSDSLWTLVKPNVVYPDVATVDRMIEELPATLVRLSEAVIELAGARATELSGKS